MNHKALLVASLAALTLFSCGGETPKAATSAVDSFFASPAPSGATSIVELRAAKAGDEVVVTGRAKDFVEGRAQLTLIDNTAKACDEAGPMDTCPTPWDFCCDDPRDIAKLCATLQLRDASGVIKEGLRGHGGLEHLDTVIASGKLETDSEGNLTVNASRIAFVKRTPPPPRK